jgi:argininosuccinate lyase
VAETIGRLAVDGCLFTSQNFGFIHLPDAFTTGSSIMPQKKNPDVFELVRGHCNRIQGIPAMLRHITGNLPSGYFRDMQLLKEVYLPMFDELDSCLDILCFALPGITVTEGLMDKPLYAQAFCVEEVNRLVEAGVPFRDAYRQVGLAVQNGTFHYEGELHHTHEGSIGNLCTAEIRAKFHARLSVFPFDRVNQAVENLMKNA